MGQKLGTVRPGNYPELLSEGVNHPECGQRYLTRPHKLYFNRKCFLNELTESTYWDIDLTRDEFNIAKRIVGSEQAEYAESPWTVILTQQLFRFIPTSDCTGVLIALDWAMTAAHCHKNV